MILVDVYRKHATTLVCGRKKNSWSAQVGANRRKSVQVGASRRKSAQVVASRRKSAQVGHFQCLPFFLIHRCSDSLSRLLGVLWCGFFIFSSVSDVIKIFLNQLKVRTFDFSDQLTDRNSFSASRCVLSAPRLHLILWILSCWMMWTLRWSCLWIEDFITKKHFTHTEKRKILSGKLKNLGWDQ